MEALQRERYNLLIAKGNPGQGARPASSVLAERKGANLGEHRKVVGRM
jgi:hypothetical protein